MKKRFSQFTLFLLLAGIMSAPSAHAVGDFELLPAFDFDLDVSQKLINQTPDKDHDGAVDLDDFRDGFRVRRSRALEAGVGVIGAWGEWHLLDGPFQSFLPVVGVLPIAGAEAYADQYAETRDQADLLPPIRVPYRATDLSAWSVKDSMAFRLSGAILFFGGATNGYAFAGPLFLAKGKWSTYVEKTGPTKVYVKINSDDLYSLSVAAGTALSVVDLGVFKGSDDSFSYTFDLRDPAAVAAYEDLMRGNVAAAQELSAKGHHSIQLDKTTKAKWAGSFLRFWFGIPFLFEVDAGATRLHAYRMTLKHSDGTESEAHYGAYVEDASRRSLFNQHHKRVRAFVSVAAKNTSAEMEQRSKKTGIFLWSDQNDDASSSSLRRAIRDLVASTGMKDRLAVQVPDAGDLGYAGVKLKLVFPEAVTQAVTTLGGGESVLSRIQKTGKDLVHEYFAKVTDTDQLCSAQERQNHRVYECGQRLAQETKSALTYLDSCLKRMSRYQDTDDAEFAAAYRDFGRAFMTNRFTFQTVLRELSGQPIRMEYVIEGERLLKYTDDSLSAPDAFASQGVL